MSAGGGNWLKQKDVDAVFGVVPARPEVLPYDFLAAPRLPRERRLVLAASLERLVPAVASLLSARLRRPVDVVAAEPETTTAGDLVHALRSPCAGFAFTVGHSHGVADLGVPFSLYLVERLFGGEGQEQLLDRPLTALEQHAVQGVAEKVPELLRDAFRLPAIGPQSGACESDPSALPLRERDQAMIVFRLDLRAPGLQAAWTLALPLVELDPLFVAAAAADAVPPQPPSLESARELQQAHLTVVARLPLFRMRARELAVLTTGQSVSTGHPVDTPAEVLVNGRVRFRGVIGQSHGRLGLRIIETVATPLPARPERDREGRAL